MNFSEIISTEFSALSSLYFNSAYFGPSPQRSRKKLDLVLKKEFDPSFYPYENWIHKAEELRGLLAQLLDCSADCIAHGSSSSDNISLLSHFLPLNADDEVIIFEGEYPSNVLPWLVAAENRKIKVTQLPPAQSDLQWFKDHLPSKAKVVNLSHIAFDSGRKMNLKEIGSYLKQRGIYFVVDCTQSLGAMPIQKDELEFIDFLTCSTYKWLLGPYGHSFFYITEELQKMIPRMSGNWIVSKGVENVNELTHYHLETLPGARKYDRGQGPNMVNLSMLAGSLELLLELGLEKIWQHNQKLTEFFKENYNSNQYELLTPVDNHGSILSLKTENPFELSEKLKNHNIDVSIRESKIRLSFHLFNNLSQVEKLLSVL